MGKRTNITKILQLLPPPKDITLHDAVKRLKANLSSKELQKLHGHLAGLPPKALELAASIGPAGLSKFDEAKSIVQTSPTNFAESFKTIDEAVVVWLAWHPDGKKFLDARGA